MKVTKREVLASIVIVCLMLTIGFFISNEIDAELLNKYQEYNTAMQIVDDAELFEYAMRTNVGNAFIHGDLAAATPISINDIKGEYSYIRRDKERYTKHSRTETYRDSKGNSHTRVVHYWTWDLIDRDKWHCAAITYLGHEFDYGTIELPAPKYYGIKDCGYHLRYVYYVCAPKYIGTLYTRIDNHTIEQTTFYNEYEIEDCIKRLESGWQKILFWVVWIIIICATVYGFYYLENDWLESYNKEGKDKCLL